ncbi:hypothetical protein AAFF_G00368570 [Aldrovandia affinis]|uniref:Uncharacterized protein n=1 Tax=Aldrovandia affinis TaxID=143900 RepID=A0AAD7SH16_9TELE|nr:hypothetical protein AAFF_G00368570 [Aldrovandia affinis]
MEVEEPATRSAAEPRRSPSAALTADLAEEVKIKDGGQRLAPRPGPVSQEEPPRVAKMTDLSWAPTPAAGTQTAPPPSQSKHTCIPPPRRHGTDSHITGVGLRRCGAFISLK